MVKESLPIIIAFLPKRTCRNIEQMFNVPFWIFNREQPSVTTTHLNSSFRYRAEIDGLRAIAIFSVVIFHLQPELLPGGFIGVDVFFVISGFLITSIIYQRIDQGVFSIASFYRARITRLFPALLVVCLSCTVWGWFYLMPIEFSQLGRHVTSTMGFFENFTLVRESGYFDADIKLKPLAHMWSLSIEEQFYLIFPLLIIGLQSQRQWSKLLIPILGLVSLMASIRGVTTQPSTAYFLPWMRAWELLAGATLFFLPKARQITRPIFRGFLSLTGIVLIVVSAFLLNRQTPFPGAYALPPVIGAGLLIWLGIDALPSRWLLANPLMIGAGLISYPLYLWHWPLLAFLHLWPGQAVTAYTVSGAGILALLLSIMTYHWIEKPLRPHRNGTVLIRVLLFLALSLVILGMVIARTKGFPSRYPELPHELAIEKPPFPKTWRFGECFLLNHQSFSDFKPECFSTDRSPTSFSQPQSRILLWGDSYAAQLYPGLVARWGHLASISQLTAMACAPIEGLSIREYPNCPDITHFVMEHLKNQSYDTVIIAGNWDGIFKHGHQEEFESTIRSLVKAGIKNLVIYGPPPLWTKALPKILLEDYLQQKDKRLPTRMNEMLDGRTQATEAWLKALSIRYRIGYVSIYKTLCNSDGCLVRIDQNLTSMDDGHLTEAASHLVFTEMTDLKGDH